MSTTSNDIRIRRNPSIVATVKMPLAGLWIAIRFMLVPALWLFYMRQRGMRWAFEADTVMKRALFPLTEAADETLQNHVNAPETGKARTFDAWAHANGQRFSLDAYANGRPLLLVLYRGSWCPYSRLHLADLAAAAKELDKLGVAVLAVSAGNHEAWWRSKGVGLNFASDPNGELFKTMGVLVEPPLAHRVWGMLLPHESVFLFDQQGKLEAADVRKLSSTKTKQTFLSASRWLMLARALVESAASGRQAAARTA